MSERTSFLLVSGEQKACKTLSWQWAVRNREFEGHLREGLPALP